MKYAVLITLLFISGLSATFSQTPRFGVDIGVSVNRAAYWSEVKMDRRFLGGFDGGLLLEFPVSKRLSIQPELNYLLTGVELNDGSTRQSLKLQYITIPLLAKVNVLTKLNLVLGAQHCILLSAWNDPAGIVSKRIKEYFKFNDIILVAGAEYRCKNGVFLGARYNYSIEQIAEDELGFEMKNRYISVRIGYIF